MGGAAAAANSETDGACANWAVARGQMAQVERNLEDPDVLRFMAASSPVSTARPGPVRTTHTMPCTAASIEPPYLPKTRPIGRACARAGPRIRLMRGPGSCGARAQAAEEGAAEAQATEARSARIRAVERDARRWLPARGVAGCRASWAAAGGRALGVGMVARDWFEMAQRGLMTV